MPLLAEEVGIVILKRKGANHILHQYSLQRKTVEEALKGLCFGFPHGGISTPEDGYQLYTGPDHSNMPLKGRYFQYLPNQFYNDVRVEENRLGKLPVIRNQLPGINVIEIPEMLPQQDLGPAPEQAELEHDDTDESNTASGVACPLEPQDCDKELNSILDKLIGKEGAGQQAVLNGQVASVNWDHIKGKPLSELSTEGFFSMAFPTIFINGSCDYSTPKLVNINFEEWIKHIYFTGDGRVSKHPYLKFLLLNLRLRKMALDQGSFLVSQQLNDAHLTIAELAENLRNNDDSVPRKIINVGANLPNSHPYWRNKKHELDNMLFYRLMEFGDNPAYFDSNSCAEYHCVPLLNLLIKYYSLINQKDESVIREKVNSDNKFKRSLVLENLHIVTNYFDTRTINYYASVMKETLQYDDVWWRYEFAASRGGDSFARHRL